MVLSYGHKIVNFISFLERRHDFPSKGKKKIHDKEKVGLLTD
jgi:hypothetical protein